MSNVQQQGQNSRGGGRNRRDRKEKENEESGMPGDLLDRVVKIKRCAAVVKGGRRFSFAAMVVWAMARAKWAVGMAKANEVHLA